MQACNKAPNIQLNSSIYSQHIDPSAKKDSNTIVEHLIPICALLPNNTTRTQNQPHIVIPTNIYKYTQRKREREFVLPDVQLICYIIHIPVHVPLYASRVYH